jgi:hypothetical protein
MGGETWSRQLVEDLGEICISLAAWRADSGPDPDLLSVPLSAHAMLAGRNRLSPEWRAAGRFPNQVTPKMGRRSRHSGFVEVRRSQ